MKYFFQYDLVEGKISKDTFGNPAIRYYETEDKKSKIVEIGDGYRHNFYLTSEDWNNLVERVKNKKWDKETIDIIFGGLMDSIFEEDSIDDLVESIRSGVISKIQ